MKAKKKKPAVKSVVPDMLYFNLNKLEKRSTEDLLAIAELEDTFSSKKELINYILSNDLIINKIKKNNEKFIDYCCKYRTYVDVTVPRTFNEWMSIK